MAEESLLERKYFDGIYIPAGLLVFGTVIVKSEWTLYAALVALVLGAIKYFRMLPSKVLKPNVFQEFELKEKTVISHNVA
ncbi:NADH-cytochrome b5 reductase, partial [Neurospora sp. IMI 360204]